MTYTYIPCIPKPLLKDFINNRVVPFVGAGFSKNADIPENLSIPDWNELGKLVAAEINDYEYDNNPIDALSYYESLYSRAKLVEFLMRALNVGKIKPGDTYTAFCKLFTGTICTTNFDFLLEEEMNALHRPISTVVTEDRLTINTPDESRILKLHGDFNHPDRMIITEHDYDMYLENNPIFATYISNLFINNTMLLIGYSLDDSDFRSLWQIINKRLGGMTQPAYCVTVGASPALIARYTRRKIHVINLPGKTKDYKKILHGFFSELYDYISKERDKNAISKDDRINEQLIIPSDSNKLCFISCSAKRIARLTALLYPILQKQGVTPVRIDDMLMPGDNFIDVVSTIIRKSNMAIVDISDETQGVLAELSMLQAEKKRVIIISESDTELSQPFMNHVVLKYSLDDVNEDNKSFEKQIIKWIDSANISTKKKSNTSHPSIFKNASRLLKKEEYSACIVSAYSDFEYTMRNKFPDYQIGMHLIDSLCEDRVISPVEYKELKEIKAMRNGIVHGVFIATIENAEHALEVLSDVVNRIDLI